MTMYKLNDDYTTTKISDPAEFSATLTDAKRFIKCTHVNEYRVSTVFFGIEYNFGDSCFPVLFETMIFEGDGWHDLYCQRYSSYEEALNGHKQMVLKAADLPTKKDTKIIKNKNIVRADTRAGVKMR